MNENNKQKNSHTNSNSFFIFYLNLIFFFNIKLWKGWFGNIACSGNPTRERSNIKAMKKKAEVARDADDYTAMG